MTRCAPPPVALELVRSAAKRFGLRLTEDRQCDLAAQLAREGLDGAPTEPADLTVFLGENEKGRAVRDFLAAHLTVAETYFFREKAVFAQLEREFLPELTRRAEDEGRGLTIWSAGCATGEEAYSAAIALTRATLGALPPGSRVVGTDINQKALDAALRGVYREWSFRGTPQEIKDLYFQKSAKGVYAISPRIKEYASFFRLNLAGKDAPGTSGEPVAADLIFCRNVLMYFEPQAAARALARLLGALRPGGLFILSPSETGYVAGTSLALAGRGGTAIYRKPDLTGRVKAAADAPAPDRKAKKASPRLSAPAISSATTPAAAPVAAAPKRPRKEPGKPPVPDAECPDEALYRRATLLYGAGRYGEAVSELESWLTTDPEAVAEPGLFAREITLLASILANLGEADKAVDWCRNLACNDTLNAKAQFALGAALREAGRLGEAEAAFKRALYLDGAFAAAELALAGLCRERGETDRAAKHYANVAAMLDGLPGDAEVPESGGLAVAVVREIAAAFGEPRR